jgi:glutathione synthase/RimK-type ligase-like ATP-grasp enzyme
MKFIIRNIKRFIRLFYALTKINWIIFFKNYSTSDGIIVLIPGIFKNYFINFLELDVINIAALIKLNQKFCIRFGIDFSSFKNRKICYNVSSLFNPDQKISNAEYIAEKVKFAEQNGNNVFLSSHDILFWENKEFMHSQFERLKIKTPKTQIINLAEDPQISAISFPCLIKELHSHASLGVHKCDSLFAFQKLIQDKNFRKNNNKIIVQQLLNIRKDLRVILSDENILLFYWRINLGNVWKPTSTSHGSGVDFEFFPEQWRKYIIENFQKLGLVTGAFDIAWENDDLGTEPYFLEVSPSYQPNPKIDLFSKNYSYGQFKKRFALKNSWDILYLKTVFEIRQTVYSTWLKNIN